MEEAPWPDGPCDATLDWTWGDNHPGHPDWEGLGILWFISPETEGWHAGRRCYINVSKTVDSGGSIIDHQNVWQLMENGDGTVTVSPSVHFIGHFHSPKPVVFRLVAALPEEG